MTELPECASNCKAKPITELLRMSLVPVPCQECSLDPRGCIRSECIDWIRDLKNKTPVWSRLNDINTGGYNRKLPMSMTKHYDIEIRGRLWSLWCWRCKHDDAKFHDKSYLASTVIALCTARVISLNLWTPALMNCILLNGQTFYENSLKTFKGRKKYFQLENLDKHCCLEGIGFCVCFKAVQKGRVYSVPLKCHKSLAYALIQFFQFHQFGILECNKHVLGFGCIGGPRGGYIMFDAQDMNGNIFPKGYTGAYLLRTNHLQVLLYCLIITLNITKIDAAFSLHRVHIKINESQNHILKSFPGKCVMKCAKMKAHKCLTATSVMSLKSGTSETPAQISIPQRKSSEPKTFKQKYLRNKHNISKEEAKIGVIRPTVDPDLSSEEDIRICYDFVRMICSQTDLPLMPADEKRPTKDFTVESINDALVMGLQAKKNVIPWERCPKAK